MADLAQFIRARLDEDEAEAWEAHYEGQRWLTEEEGVYRYPDDELVRMADRKADARHIANWSPARVLREVEALRAIVDQLEHSLSYRPPVPVGKRGEWALASLVAEAVAGIWRDYPDYDPAWSTANEDMRG